VMPDPREEAVARHLNGTSDMPDLALNDRDYVRAQRILAAADAVDPMRRRKSGSHRLTDPAEFRARLADVEHDATTSAAAVARLYELLAEAVARAETAEAACETSGAALVVMNDLLKEAEADRDTLTEALRDLDVAWSEYSRMALAGGMSVDRRRAQLDAVRDRVAALAAVKGREENR
jgi:hypothetical protein